MEKPIFKTPSVKLTLFWGSEELIASYSDVLYKGYESDDAMKRVNSEQGILKRRILKFLNDQYSRR